MSVTSGQLSLNFLYNFDLGEHRQHIFLGLRTSRRSRKLKSLVSQLSQDSISIHFHAPSNMKRFFSLS